MTKTIKTYHFTYINKWGYAQTFYVRQPDFTNALAQARFVTRFTKPVFVKVTCTI